MKQTKAILIDNKGNETEMLLPGEVFGQEKNEQLIAQAVRVGLMRKRSAAAKTKTRAEIDRTKAKWFKQKGTGRARHGARSAPIFVGGGIAHGPNGTENWKLTLPRKMRLKALAVSLSQRLREGNLKVFEEGALDKFSSKEMKKLIGMLVEKGNKVSLVFGKKDEKLIMSARNIDKVEVLDSALVNAFDIVESSIVLIGNSAVEVFKKRFKLQDEAKIEVKKASKTKKTK